MNEIQLFNNEELNCKVRTVEIDGKPYFVGNDVARALGYVDCPKAIRTHCKGVAEMSTPTKGGIQTLKVIPEGDVYRLIIKSKLPQAEKFETWVMDEVLPTIRKTGSYSNSQVPTISKEETMVLDVFNKRHNVGEFVLALGSYGDFKFEEGGSFICNENIITLSRVAEMIQHTLQDEFDKLKYYPNMGQLGGEFSRFLICEGYFTPRFFVNIKGNAMEKQKHNQPTQLFYDVFVTQAMATARKVSDGRDKVITTFTNNIYKYILSETFKTKFMKFIYKTHPILVEAMELNEQLSLGSDGNNFDNK